MSKMIIYKVYCKNYDLRKGEFMGVFVERRKDLRGESRLESGLSWAKLMFGKTVRDKSAIFVVPQELNLEKDSIMPAEKMIFSKDEFLLKGKSSHYDFFSFSPSKKLIN